MDAGRVRQSSQYKATRPECGLQPLSRPWRGKGCSVCLFKRREGCPMDKNWRSVLDESVDIPSMVALMVFVGLWGFATCTAAMYFTALTQ